jgi:hypothetical protein
MGESPTEFNNNPENLSPIWMETFMNINWGDFLRHLGMQVLTAAVTAGVAALAHYDYSSLGVIAPMAQGAAALATTAWNTYEAKLLK